ncbi:MAG: hypothetical protein JWO65_2541 [Sphingomonas bacterium]|jgi:3-methylfumaryl-CoA hydratase|nr:hypothetical protein [Sphingomonas bacterium]
MTIVSETALAEWRATIGRRESRTQMLDTESLRRFSVAVGGEGDVSAEHPPLAHWAWFLEVTPDALLGEDGHPRRGGFLPAIEALPRRMFASTAIHFEMPLLLDIEAEAVMRITDVRHKAGRSGDLVFVDIERTISQKTRTRVVERQTLVYREAGDATPMALPIPASDAVDMPAGGELWQPNPVHLFRFSAATFNGHRIHYDHSYANEVEGYPALIVQGPFAAAKLAALAAKTGPLARFEFRAQAPLFVDQQVRLARMGDGEFHAIRCDGVPSTIAKATYR